MIWVFVTLGSALLWSFLNIVSKDIMKEESSLDFTVLYTFSATIFYFPLFIYFVLNTNLISISVVWIVLILSGIANTVGILLYNKAIKQGELSSVIPLTRLTPIFVVFNSFLFLGESITVNIALGALFVTLGSYIILLREGRGWMEPIKNFISSISPKLAVLSAFVYSFASIADRYATQRIDPGVYTFLILFIMALNFNIYLRYSQYEIKSLYKPFKKRPLTYISIGGMAALATYFIFIGFSLAKASKVISVLQIQVLISVIAGGFFFKEKKILRKFIGSILLILGVIITIL